MSQLTILILGANGRIGRAAVQAFSDAGWRVLAQARRAPTSLPTGAVHLPNALDDVAGLVAASAGAKAVVYAVNPAYTRWTQELLPLARHGMALAERLGALFMLPGNVYAYGEHMPPLLREDTPEQPTTEKGRQRQALEAELRERSQQGRLRAVVIRAGDFYGGQGTGSWLDLAVLKSLGKGQLVYPGPLDRIHAWAYLPDLARAFVAVASRSGAPAFATFHFAGHAETGHEFLAHVEAAADELGLRPAKATPGWRRAGMPWGVMRLLGLVMPMLREVTRMSYLWRVPHALDGTALARAVGPLPGTPSRLALRQAMLDLGLVGGTQTSPTSDSPAAAAAR